MLILYKKVFRKIKPLGFIQKKRGQKGWQVAGGEGWSEYFLSEFFGGDRRPQETLKSRNSDLPHETAWHKSTLKFS